MVKGSTIVVGITGSIAAYKTPEIIRWLDKNGATVHVIMTKAATEFLTPLLLRELSHHPVIVEQFAEPAEFDVQHISLAQKADLMIIVPATANIIGKIASGIADDMLSTTIMAATCPVLLCPAMNTQMFLNPIVQENIVKLEKKGYTFIQPAEGDLLCGQKGIGHLAVLEDIYKGISQLMTDNKKMSGLKVLITAGGTREYIDPVRFIGNLSSGKMGMACASAAQKTGADVTLIAANIQIPIPPQIDIITVVDTAEMEKILMDKVPSFDIIIMAAAISDFRAKTKQPQKIKREEKEELSISLIANPDLAKKIATLKNEKQVFIGFAAESENLLQNAEKKLKDKKFDFIVANDITMPESGFMHDTNKAVLVTPKECEELPLMLKTELGEIIMHKALQIWEQKNIKHKDNRRIRNWQELK